jgi:hypothetical protein
MFVIRQRWCRFSAGALDSPVDAISQHCIALRANQLRSLLAIISPCAPTRAAQTDCVLTQRQQLGICGASIEAMAKGERRTLTSMWTT